MCVAGMHGKALEWKKLAEDDSSSKLGWTLLNKWMRDRSWLFVIMTCGRKEYILAKSQVIWTPFAYTSFTNGQSGQKLEMEAALIWLDEMS